MNSQNDIGADQMQDSFDIDSLAAQCPEMDTFWGLDGISDPQDPMWLVDEDDSLIPVTTPVLEDTHQISPSPVLSTPSPNCDADENELVSELFRPNPTTQICPEHQPAIVKIEAPLGLWNTWNPSAYDGLVSSPSSESDDPTYLGTKFEFPSPSANATPRESPAPLIKSKNKLEYQAFDDPSGLFPDFVGWSVILSTPYGTLVAEKKLPLGTIMYARNRLVYVWLPQKHMNKLPILAMGEFTMPKSQCGSHHGLCFKRPYSKFTTLIAPSAPSEFFICMDPSTNCRSNAHKSTGSDVVLKVCMEPSTVSTPIAQYRLAVQSYDSQAKSGRVLSGILCLAFLFSGAMGTIFNSAQSSKSFSTGRVLMEDEVDSSSSTTWQEWFSTISNSAWNVLISSRLSELVLGLVLLVSCVALLKNVDFASTSKRIKDSFVSGRAWASVVSVFLFFSVISRCYYSAAVPSLSSLGTLDSQLSLFQLSPISLVVLLFSAQYLLGEGQSNGRDDDDTPGLRARVLTV